MTFQFCESMIDDYWTHGFAIFRGIVPPSLRRDLRREADKARFLNTRDHYGPEVGAAALADSLPVWSKNRIDY